MATSPTVASPPTTAEVAAILLAYQFGQSGTVSDSNPGSQVRTLSEAFGQVAELEGISAMAIALQSMAYGCFAAVGIIPFPASQAQGTLIFSTGPLDPPPATQNVVIAAGTIAQTTAGVQYQTTETVTLLSGTTSISTTAQAVLAGAAGNTGIGTVISVVSGIPYPLYVNNSSQFTGGTNAETIGQTMSRFTAYIQSIGLASPVAIANAAVGVQATPSTETVEYATVYEPWVTQSPGSQQAGFTVYIDNGSGTASTALVNAVVAKLNGVYPTASGYRDAGVPYAVLAVTPVQYSVIVAGSLINPANDASGDADVTTAVQAYQNSLQFGSSIQAAFLNAVVGDALEGTVLSFTVALFDSLDNPQTVIAVPSYSRAQLTSLTVNLS